MTDFKCPPIHALKTCILDLLQPIGKRTTAAFYLRTIGTIEAAEIIAEALKLPDSALMRHELAYILGQMQHKELCPVLSSILQDEEDDVLVRHESAEALGAIGDILSIDILRKYCHHQAPEIAETCRIAIDLIEWKHSNREEIEKSAYFLSEDPAPAIVDDKTSVKELEAKLMNCSDSHFLRYRAMFSLRNINSDESSLALCSGFQDTSALFRHEVAYVLGQMCKKVTIPALTKVLEDKKEHRMVRHEAAEALGAIGGEQVELLLSKYADDDEIVVKESCDVALDAIEYWSTGNGNQFEEISSLSPSVIEV